MLQPSVLTRWRSAVLPAFALLLLLVDGALSQALAHGVADGDKGYIQETIGVVVLPFVYLGAKHMVTGYDHLLRSPRSAEARAASPPERQAPPIPQRPSSLTPAPAPAAPRPRLGISSTGKRGHAFPERQITFDF